MAEHPFEDIVDLFQVGVDGEAGLDLGRRQSVARMSGSARDEGLEVEALVPGLEAVALDELVGRRRGSCPSGSGPGGRVWEKIRPRVDSMLAFMRSLWTTQWPMMSIVSVSM